MDTYCENKVLITEGHTIILSTSKEVDIEITYCSTCGFAYTAEIL